MIARFKIDFKPGHGTYSAFRLMWRSPTWYGGRWVEVYTFDTQDKAREHYEKIKDLPEYLP